VTFHIKNIPKQVILRTAKFALRPLQCAATWRFNDRCYSYSSLISVWWRPL